MSMQDSLTIGYLVFSMALIVFALGLVKYVLTQADPLMEMDAFREAMEALALFDYAAPAMLVGSFVSSLYMSAKVKAKPIYLPVSFLFLAIATFVGYIFTVIPEEMAKQTVAGEVFASMPLTSAILSNMHFVVLVSGLAGMIALYALQNNTGGRGGQRAPL